MTIAPVKVEDRPLHARYERLIVRESLRLEVTMAPAHELLRRLGEVPKHLRNHPRRLPRAQRAGTSQVVHEFLVHLSCARHPCSMPHRLKETQESCPESGKNRPILDN